MPDSNVALAAAKVASPKLIEDDDDIDDEIVEVFIEEAGEVRETLDEQFPIWKKDFQNHDALTVLRRAFHTLKGSGRMVKANDIGELAWSVENMLNRVIDKTVPASLHHANLIERVIAVLPSMIEAYANRQANPKQEETQQYMTLGNALASGEFPEALAGGTPAGQQEAASAEGEKQAELAKVKASTPEARQKPVAVESDRVAAERAPAKPRKAAEKPALVPSETAAAASQPSSKPAKSSESPAGAAVERLQTVKPKLKPVPPPPPRNTAQPNTQQSKPSQVAKKPSKVAKAQSKKQAAQSVARMNAKPTPPPASSRWSMVWAVVLLVAMVAIFGLLLF